MRLSPALCPCLLAVLAACGSSSHSLVIQVSPPEASVFVNGERISRGSSRVVHDVSFAGSPRAFVQVTAPGYEPSLDVLTEEDVRRLVDRDLPFSKSLRPQ